MTLLAMLQKFIKKLDFICFWENAHYSLSPATIFSKKNVAKLVAALPL